MPDVKEPGTADPELSFRAKSIFEAYSFGIIASPSLDHASRVLHAFDLDDEVKGQFENIVDCLHDPVQIVGMPNCGQGVRDCLGKAVSKAFSDRLKGSEVTSLSSLSSDMMNQHHVHATNSGLFGSIASLSIRLSSILA